jgi:hypothetical protein
VFTRGCTGQVQATTVPASEKPSNVVSFRC